MESPSKIYSVHEYEVSFIAEFKGTPLKSTGVTHSERNFSKTCFFLLSMCVVHCSLSCGALHCLLWAIHLKCVLYMLISEMRYISILNRVAKLIEDISRYHKVSFDTLNTLVTRK